MLNISRTRLLASAATLALTASLGTTPGLAQSPDTGTLNVSAQVDQSCSLGTINTLNFGVIEPGVTKTTDATFEVDCTLNGDVDISMSDGQHHDGTRWHMANNGDEIGYTLYDADTFSTDDLWDEAKNKPVSPGINTFTVWGQIAGGHSGEATDGTYTDQVTISVAF